MSSIKNGAYLRINSNYNLLFPMEKKIADFILENSDKIEMITISEIADTTHSSKATVTRFCKRLGYNGFKDFRVSAIKDVQLGLTDFKNLLSDHPSIEERSIEYICDANAKACTDTKLLLDSEVLKQAAEILLSKKRIFIVGDGISAPMAYDFYLKLIRLGIVACYSTDRRAQMLSISLTNETDAVIAFDLSGQNRSKVRMIEIAKKNGASTIVICCAIGSPLAKAGGLNLYAPAKPSAEFTAALAPRISVLCVVDCLFYSLEQLLGDACLDSIKRTNKAITEDRI